MKRLAVSAEEGKPLPALPAASTYMAKQPLLRAFCTDTQYDDGTARRPGYYIVDNKGTVFACTLFDRDGCARLPLTAATWDDLWRLVETMLADANAPWQPDARLAEEKKKFSKKKAS